MPRSVVARSILPVSLTAICAVLIAYGSVIVTLWLAGGATPPPAVASVIAAFFVCAAVVAATHAILYAISRLADRHAALAERVVELEEQLPASAVEPRVVGMDPESIGALRRIHDRVRSNHDGG